MPEESVCYFRVDAPGPSWSSNIGAFGEPRLAGDNVESAAPPPRPRGLASRPTRFRTIQVRPKDLQVASGAASGCGNLSVPIRQSWRPTSQRAAFRGRETPHARHAAASIHIAAGRRGSDLAGRGAGAAGGNAGDWIPQRRIASRVPAYGGRAAPGSERSRLYRGPERGDRLSLG